jgi:uncharacterized protein (DUF433 family)
MELEVTRVYTECVTAEQRNALQSVISINKDIMHGTPCFSGSRVPVQTLMDFLETGDTIDAFLAVYPSIPREQVVGFLQIGRDVIIEQLSFASS